jgi:chemotaxis protein methyltransferase CheR
MDSIGMHERIVREDFIWLQGWLFERSSIVLEDARKFLAEKRLQPLLFHLKVPDLRSLFGRLRQEPDGELGAEVLEALTQSETWFFRDMPVFEHLCSELIPGLIQRANGRRIRIWSAGCSTGQEPYSLAMALAGKLGPDWAKQVQIDACDLSARQIAHAKDGAYTRDDVNRGLPAMLLGRHFSQLGTRWHIEESLREAVNFEALRLDRAWAQREPYDLILLRNVLYYFNDEARTELIWRIRQQLAADGVLILGSAEQNELEDGFDRLEQGRFWHYRRRRLAPQVLSEPALRMQAA